MKKTQYEISEPNDLPDPEEMGDPDPDPDSMPGGHDYIRDRDILCLH